MVGSNKSCSGGEYAHIILRLLCCFAMMTTLGSAAETALTSIDCSSALLSVSDCLTFVQEGSTEVKPQGQCCSGLKKVVKEEISCLCQAFKGSVAYGIKLNMTKALTLAPACGLKTPPYSTCNIDFGAPGAAPGLSPTTLPSSSPTTGQNSARVPPSSPVHSSSASLPSKSLLFLLGLAAALVYNHL